MCSSLIFLIIGNHQSTFYQQSFTSAVVATKIKFYAAENNLHTDMQHKRYHFDSTIQLISHILISMEQQINLETRRREIIKTK